MTRRHNPKVRVVSRFARIPEQLAEGMVRCAGCSKVVKLTKTGWTRTHRSPSGEPCAYRANYRVVELDELPPVVLSNRNPPRTTRPSAKREPNVAAWADGECRKCGKWLPNGRSVCGACYAASS